MHPRFLFFFFFSQCQYSYVMLNHVVKARMESAPGTAEMPVWTKGLLWKSSGAFYIRWITICDISFYHLVPLLNRLNEDQPVFIGRDGQEIDTETGATLCAHVDDKAASMN